MGKNIYCDLGFWNHLSNQFSTVQMSPNPLVRKKIQTIMDWYNLFERSQLHFDCLIDDSLNSIKNDEYLHYLWKCWTDARIPNKDEFFAPGSIMKMCDGPSEMDFNMYNSLFLTGLNNQKQSSAVGVINICSEELFKHDELFSDKGAALQRGNKANWRTILLSNKIPHNCNSMVIADNYIFNKVDRNLYEILDALLPTRIETTFYLTIFFVNEGGASTLKLITDSLKAKIQEIRPELGISLEIFETSKEEFHDRAIITNYMWIGIPSGFDLIKGQISAKSTELHAVYPMIISEDKIKWTNERYSIFIDDAKRCLKNRNVHSNNRLLR